MESLPSVADTLRSLSMRTGVESGFSSALARSCALLASKWPLISALPPKNLVRNTGALMTLPSSRMASGSRKWALAMSSNCFAPTESKRRWTT